jgi:hypothetical protein
VHVLLSQLAHPILCHSHLIHVLCIMQVADSDEEGQEEMRQDDTVEDGDDLASAHEADHEESEEDEDFHVSHYRKHVIAVYGLSA